MADPLAVLLSGEHATLPEAELQALLDVHDPGARIERHGVVALVDPVNLEAAKQAIARMALGHEWGTLWGRSPDTLAGLAQLGKLVSQHATGKGSAAVAAERRGQGKGVARAVVEQTLGAALAATGHRIDLGAPEAVVFAWLADGNIWVGLHHSALDRSAHEERTSEGRAHFSPISLHPRRAASLLHLARVPPGGRLLDPFCGTGAFVLEAALEGYQAIGSDLDRFMVQGTMTTLTDTGPQPLSALVFKADIGDVPNLLDPVDGIVTDFPYGRASSSHDEGLAQLYDRAFAVFSRMLPSGRHAVVGCAQADLLPDLARHGFVEVARFAERMHKSLTRVFLVARRA